VQISQKVRAIGAVRCKKEGMLLHLQQCWLQPLRWHCVECVIHHERDVREEQHPYVARTSNNRVIAACELYCCLLPQCEALRTCRSGYPIATPSTRSRRISCFSFQIDHGRHKDFFQTGAMVDFSRWKAFFRGFLRKGATTLKLYFSKSKQT